jgi:hypothetical protein
VNHATARYFTLYLQEQEKLVPVYSSIRARDVRRLTAPPSDDAVGRVEREVGKPLAVIQHDFDAWCEKVVSH